VGLQGLAVDAAAVLLGQRPGEEIFADAGRLAADACSPVEDQRGPVDYKRHLADELTRRVLRGAAERAGALADVSGG
jgi:carbon-monoxide dehydrogenase medium subunit